MNQLCNVCSEPAAGFHFGAYTCEGCKSFFGRNHDNYTQISECKNGGQCIINKQNRTSCKACRLQKCFSAGMSKIKCRYGRPPNSLKKVCTLQDVRYLGNCENPFQHLIRQSTLPKAISVKNNSQHVTQLSPVVSPEKNAVEPRRNLTQTQKLQESGSEIDQSILIHGLSSNTINPLVTIDGKMLSFPVMSTSLLPNMHVLHPELQLLQAAHFYHRLYPSFLDQEANKQCLEVPGRTVKSSSILTENIDPPSPSRSLPPPSTVEHISHPSSPQSLPANLSSERCSSTPILNPPSPSFESRKRPISEVSEDQDSPIDLSIKRPKLTSISRLHGVHIIEPMQPSASLMGQVETTSSTTSLQVPLDLTSSA